MTRLPRILLVHTGGTFGMTWVTRPGPLSPGARLADVLRHVPWLDAAADVRPHVLMNEDSSDLSPAHWERIGAFLAERLPEHDGAVVLHGTDTLAFTAAALSFVLEGMDRPVVVTGAQRPIAEVRTDARGNLVHSVLLAASGLPEVTVWFGSRLFRGNRATKTRIQSYDAFESPGFPPLAEAGVDLVVHRERALPPRPPPLRLVPGFEARVLPLQLFPGAPPSLLSRAVESGEVRGVVLRAFGAGNLPIAEPGWAAAVRDATGWGIPVVLASQCGEGRVDLDSYRGGVAAREAGALPAGEMTFEAATVKLMWLLGRGLPADEVRRLFLADLAGEGAHGAAAYP